MSDTAVELLVDPDRPVSAVEDAERSRPAAKSWLKQAGNVVACTVLCSLLAVWGETIAPVLRWFIPGLLRGHPLDGALDTRTKGYLDQPRYWAALRGLIYWNFQCHLHANRALRTTMERQQLQQQQQPQPLGSQAPQPIMRSMVSGSSSSSPSSNISLPLQQDQPQLMTGNSPAPALLAAAPQPQQPNNSTSSSSGSNKSHGEHHFAESSQSLEAALQQACDEVRKRLETEIDTLRIVTTFVTSFVFSSFINPPKHILDAVNNDGGSVGTSPEAAQHILNWYLTLSGLSVITGVFCLVVLGCWKSNMSYCPTATELLAFVQTWGHSLDLTYMMFTLTPVTAVAAALVATFPLACCGVGQGLLVTAALLIGMAEFTKMRMWSGLFGTYWLVNRAKERPSSWNGSTTPDSLEIWICQAIGGKCQVVSSLQMHAWGAERSRICGFAFEPW